MLIDVSHTAHTRARTGIQRVVRNLVTHNPGATLITYDPFARAWRPLQAWEQAHLADDRPGRGRRAAAWPLAAQVRGLASRWWARRRAPALRLPLTDAPLLVPELFTAEGGRALEVLMATWRGPKVALFHDAIALQLPELTPLATVARFPRYLQELLQFDAIAAVSEDSKHSLLSYWEWVGVRTPPPVHAIPLGISPPPTVTPLPTGPWQVLSVGTLEGRKNHLALLEACERLWAEGLTFTLTLVGHCHAVTGKPAAQRVQALIAKGRSLRYLGAIPDAVLEDEYARTHFTVYPSLLEGFGLPVIESLGRGRPCVCSGKGALGETAQGGGCLTVDEPTPTALADALRRLFREPNLLPTLAEAARRRTFRTWRDYQRDLQVLLTSLAPRVPPALG